MQAINCEFIGLNADASEISNLTGLQLKLQFVSDKGDEFGFCGCSNNVVIPTKRQRVEGSSH